MQGEPPRGSALTLLCEALTPKQNQGRVRGHLFFSSFHGELRETSVPFSTSLFDPSQPPCAPWQRESARAKDEAEDTVFVVSPSAFPIRVAGGVRFYLATVTVSTVFVL
eukprot:Hpha_TRINITY_DN16507_c1_g6::TRINITY_DN16507_c1_g6_i2::g.136208::m.136208